MNTRKRAAKCETDTIVEQTPKTIKIMIKKEETPAPPPQPPPPPVAVVKKKAKKGGGWFIKQYTF
jgi:hypothetical protein